MTEIFEVLPQAHDLANAKTLLSAFGVVLLLAVFFGLMPGLALNLFLTLFPRESERRREIYAEYHSGEIPYRERWLWVFTQLEVAVSQGLRERVVLRAARRRERDQAPSLATEPGAALSSAVPGTPASAAFTAWLDGDPKGLDDLVEVLTPRVLQIVRSYRVDASAEEDIVQSVWLEFVRNHSQIPDPNAVDPWMSLIARRQSWRHERGR